MSEEIKNEEENKQETVSTPEVTYHYAYKPVKKKKKVLPKILLGMLIFALGVSGGLLGTYLGTRLFPNGNKTIVYQTVERGPNFVENKTGNTVNQISTQNADSVVEIQTESIAYSLWMTQYVTSGAGSGVIITSDGYIVTCAHVVEDSTKITVILNNQENYEARLVGMDVENDIAVIKIEKDDLVPVVIGTSSNLFVGELVVAIGNPLGKLGGTVTDGIVSALEREITIDDQTMVLIQTNAAVNPGNSGGALFNEYGELIGIVNAKSSGSDIEGIGFAIPIDNVKSIIDDLISQGYVTGKRELGLEVVEVRTHSQAQRYGYDGPGIYIKTVSENSIAEAEGFKEGDKIVSINNIYIETVEYLKIIYSNVTAGSEVSMRIERNGVEQVITFIKE